MSKLILALALCVTLVALAGLWGFSNAGQAYLKRQAGPLQISGLQSSSTAAMGAPMLTVSHILAGSRRLAELRGPDLRYVHIDPAQSVTALTDGGGEPAFRADYVPFGGLLRSAGSSKYGFGGKEADAAAWLSFGARPYNPRMGRFAAADPVTRSTRSSYAFALNAPGKFVDPSGKQEKPVAVLFYSSHAPEFLVEVNQYISNYKNRFEFRVYAVYGQEEVAHAFEEVNTLIASGRTVARVNYFDHAGSVMFGMDAYGWMDIPRLTGQPGAGRCTLMGTCGGGEGGHATLGVMAGKAGSEYFVGTKGQFFGVTRKPRKNDLTAVLVEHEKESEPIYLTAEQALSKAPDFVTEDFKNPDVGSVSWHSESLSTPDRIVEPSLTRIGENYYEYFELIRVVEQATPEDLGTRPAFDWVTSIDEIYRSLPP